MSENGYAVVEGAVSAAEMARIVPELHARLAWGDCPTFGTETRSGWMRKDCPLPVDWAVTSDLLRRVSKRFAAAIEAATGENPQVCEFSTMHSFPGAAPQNPHEDISHDEDDGSSAALTVVLYVNGVVDGGAPLEVWPRTHKGRDTASATSRILGPLAPGTAVLYDGSLYHRGTANTARDVRTTLYVTYCRDAEEHGATQSPELEEEPLSLADVVDGAVGDRLAYMDRYDNAEEDDACFYALERFLPGVAYDDVDVEAANAGVDYLEGDPQDDCPTEDDESAATISPPCAWPRMTCSSTVDEACRPDAYARGTAQVFRHLASVVKEDPRLRYERAQERRNRRRAERARAPDDDDDDDDDDEEEEEIFQDCDMTLRQAMAQVGIYRKDSALWSLVDQRSAWALAPPGRRELLRAASGVVDAAVERETIDAAARETPVRGCPKMPWFSEDRRCHDYRKPPPPMDENDAYDDYPLEYTQDDDDDDEDDDEYDDGDSNGDGEEEAEATPRAEL